VTVGLLLIVTHQVRRPVAEQSVEPQQWLESEPTQMIPVGAAAGSPRPGASPRSAIIPAGSAGIASGSENTAPITPISPDEGGDEPTEVVELPGGRP